MAKAPRPGSMRGRVHLQRKEDPSPSPWPVDNDWATVLTVSCEFIPSRGSETVIASRLQGIQPYTLRFRQSDATRQIDETWRAVDARDESRVFVFKSPPIDPDQKRAWLEVLVEQGRLD